jgi:hypothetical protein
MTKTTKTDLILSELATLKVAIRTAWDNIRYDAGSCTPEEMAELALDRLDGYNGKTIDRIIQKYGYGAVERVVANHIL